MHTVSQKILALLTIIPEISEPSLEELTFPHRYIHRTFLDNYHIDSIYKALRKLQSQNFIERINKHGRPHLKLTPQGREEIITKVPFFKRGSQEWDGHWRIVLFDIPEGKRQRRDLLRRHLKQLGFGQWQKSVWVSPFKVEELLTDFFEKRPHYREYIELLKARRFWASSDQELANTVWKIERLNNQYRQLAFEWDAAFERYEEDFRSLSKLAAQLQERFITLLLKDPGLPRQLLPEEWHANKAKQFFLEWKTILEKYAI